MDDELELDCDPDTLCKTARKNLKRASRLQRTSTATEIQWQRGSSEATLFCQRVRGFVPKQLFSWMVLDPSICPRSSIR